MKSQIQTGILLAILIIGIVLGILFLYDIFPLLLLVVIAIVFTTGIDPFVLKLQSLRLGKWHCPRALATIIVMLVAAVILLGIFTLLLFTAVKESLIFAHKTWPAAHEAPGSLGHGSLAPLSVYSESASLL